MAQTITIRIENSSEHADRGVMDDSLSGGVPTPVISGVGSSVDGSAVAAPTPFDKSGYVAQVDGAPPSPSPDLFLNASADTADIPTPFSEGAEFGSVTTAPMPTDAMLPGASGDQTSAPSPNMIRDAVDDDESEAESGKTGSDEGARRKAKK